MRESILKPLDASPEIEWQHIAAATPGVCREVLERVVASDVQQLATHFYTYMLEHPQARVFLDHDAVHTRPDCHRPWAHQVVFAG